MNSLKQFIGKPCTISVVQINYRFKEEQMFDYFMGIVEEFDDKWFTCQFLPPQSCELNPIERVWNLIKGQWRKNSFRILDISRKKEDQLVATVDAIKEIAGNLNKDLMLKIARCNYEAMTKTL